MSLNSIMSSPFFLPFVLPFLGVIITAYVKVTPLSKSFFDGSRDDYNLGFDFAIAAHIIFIVEISNMLKNTKNQIYISKYFNSILIGTGAFICLSIICLELVKKFGVEESVVEIKEPNGEFKESKPKRYNLKAFIISWIFGLVWSVLVVFYAISIGEYK
ncbi:hypothetical protein PDL02_20650 [Bacillus cereus group sp. LD113LC]|nr:MULTISPECIES: hypothetical protein [unclassified Bacillus cereus group]MDA1542418.1 hypothetical protein [Bacillus cereus group sp. TH244-1LC]MDA1621267.1 hypothetical protein [Bacillus cereus group sp. TH206-1LC]MDA1751921.1 hypothetical protein [Bacillus cereus group sp. LD113LC]HDX9674324.1 hypothetical protein [Bacillus cereus]